MTTQIPVQRVGQHELNMCCGTTCNSRANQVYVKRLEEELRECKAKLAAWESAVSPDAKYGPASN